MDFATAKKEAATRSLATKKDQFVNLKEDSTHEVATKAGKTPMAKFAGGQEVSIEASKKPVKKVAAPKKVVAAKKVVAKKPAPKKEVKTKTNKVMKKSAKKVVDRVAVPTKGNTVTMTAKQLRAKVLEGKHVYNTKGRAIPCTKMASDDPAKKLKVISNKSGFFITR